MTEKVLQNTESEEYQDALKVVNEYINSNHRLAVESLFYAFDFRNSKEENVDSYMELMHLVIEDIAKNEEVKFSDISGWYTWTTKAGFDCSLEYYLSRISEFIIGVNIHVTLSNGKGSEQTFFEVLGNNPLKLSMAPQKEDWGRYVYSNVLRLNANDSSAADQIASITNNAYASINETIASYQKMQSENK